MTATTKLPLPAIRAIMGWTQDDMADKMGVSRSLVANWERGAVEMRPVYVHALSGLTGISESDILLPEVSTK